MRQLNLQRTWYEIFTYLSTNPNLLRIAELINRVPPCCWTFRFTFDGTGRITMKIDCDQTLSDNDAFALLDGSLEEVFFADSISLRQTGKYVTANISEFFKNPPSSNQITLHSNLSKEANFLLILNGFGRSNITSPEIQHFPTVHSYFLENTWLGSPGFANSDYYIRWIVFAEECLIRPQNRYIHKLGTTDHFTTEVNLYSTNGIHIGQANFHTDPSLKKDEIYTTFGPFVSEKKNWLTRSRRDLHWIVEIGSESLKRTAISGGFTSKLINELVDSVENAQMLVTESDSFQNYQQKIQWQGQAKAADILKERQERARQGARVTFNDKPVMLVPSNENEVLVLLSKLEALNALPFYEFILWEYTARSGIDAIASYQIRKVDAQYMFIPVELEHYFESFCDHEHPHHQVNLVICWDFRNPETALKLYKHSNWLFEYRNGESFFVVLLSCIPNLQIEKE